MCTVYMFYGYIIWCVCIWWAWLLLDNAEVLAEPTQSKWWACIWNTINRRHCTAELRGYFGWPPVGCCARGTCVHGECGECKHRRQILRKYNSHEPHYVSVKMIITTKQLSNNNNHLYVCGSAGRYQKPLLC